MNSDYSAAVSARVQRGLLSLGHGPELLVQVLRIPRRRARRLWSGLEPYSVDEVAQICDAVGWDPMAVMAANPAREAALLAIEDILVNVDLELQTSLEKVELGQASMEGFLDGVVERVNAVLPPRYRESFEGDFDAMLREVAEGILEG
ncbi:hypothetical protein BE11_04350 [Sorangium cellulosum]|nr:hypothetical protein BE11_04350 [Sorangium cellulosum]